MNLIIKSITIIIILIFINNIHTLNILNDNKSNKEITIKNNQNNSNNQDKLNYDLSDTDLLENEADIEFKELENTKTSCCILATKAAQKGFHCNSKFYSNKLIPRIRNRTHRKHMQIIGDRNKYLLNYYKFVNQLSKCFEYGLQDLFELCCWSEVEKNLEY